MFRTTDQPTPDEREARIERIVQQALAAWEAGRPVDDAELLARHPDLLPKLAENLRTAHTIFQARKKAVATGHDHDSCDSADGRYAGIQFPRNHFPGYEILERIEHGWQGVVFKAVQLATDRIVALKVLLDGPLSSSLKRERFAREVDLISRLQHPNIVTIFDSGVVDGRPYFAMEFVDGPPIDDYVLLIRPTVQDCIRLFLPVCRAVHHAHQKGIIHRDLKPMNILVDQEGRPQILDFGLAKSLEVADDSSYSMLSMVGQIIGTLQYMSPEQVIGDSQEVDTLSDVYALGVILYRLLTGMFPYPVSSDPVEMRRSILEEEPLGLSKVLRKCDSATRPTIGAVDDDLDKIILKTLSKDRQRRYQSAIALADDLDRYLKGEPVQAKAASSLYVLKKTVRRYRLQFAAAAVIAFTMTAATLLTTYYGLKATRDRDNARAVAAFAHSLFDEVTTTIEEDMASLAGGTAMRDKHLANLAERLVTLQELVEADGGMGDLKLKLYEKRGDIAATQARNSEAREYYEQVLRLAMKYVSGDPETRVEGVDQRALTAPLLEAPASEAPASREALLLHLRIRTKLGRLWEDDCIEQFEEGVRVGRRLVAQYPEDRQVHHEVCRLLVLYAGTFVSKNRYAEANEVLDLVEQFGSHDRLAVGADGAETPGTVRPARPDEDRIRLNEQVTLADLYAIRGRVRSEMGIVEESLADVVNSKAILSRLSEAHPTNVLLMHGYKRACDRLATTYQVRGNWSEAASNHKEAIRIGEYLVSVEPNISEWRRELVRAYLDLVFTYISQGVPEEAEPWVARAKAAAQPFLETQDLAPRDIESLAYAHAAAARVHRARKEGQNAYAEFEEARLIWARITEADEEADKADLKAACTHAICLDYLGSCAIMLEARDAALARFIEAYEIRTALARENPDSSDLIQALLSSCNKLTVWHIYANTEDDDRAAEFWMDQADQLFERFCRAGFAETRRAYYENGIKAIEDNRGIVERRKARRFAANSAPSRQPE